MNNIPTAEEFIRERYDWSTEDLEKWENAMKKLPMADFSNVIDLMDSFAIVKAKLHVEAALKAAAEKADITYTREKTWDFTLVDKDSILNAYPLNLIK